MNERMGSGTKVSDSMRVLDEMVPLLQRHNRLGHSRLLPAPKLTVIR